MGEHELLHARRAAIGRRAHVGIVGAGEILGLGLERIAVEAAATKVVVLRVASRFVETDIVIPVMPPVVGVEQLGNGGTLLIAGEIGRASCRESVCPYV